MGLLDSIMTMAGGPNVGKLLGAAENLIKNAGGLDGLVGKFHQSGSGEAADSWVSTGDNQPVSEEQVRQAIGDEGVAQVAQDAGVSHGDALSGLTKFLPGLVNHLTPNGQMPDMGQLSQVLKGLDIGALLKMIK